jgi:hypothetical protein
MKSLPHALVIGALLGAAFLAGQWMQPEPRTLVAQGRGPVTPVQTEPTAAETASENGLLTFPDQEGSQTAFANGFLAVTGSYGVGTSVLYLVDTNTRQLAVYEARGGSPSMRRLMLVAARRIDLDLQLESYNDESEYHYSTLKRMFEERGSRSANRGR